MVHAKGFQDKQDQYWISVDLGFQPKKDPAKCLVMVLLKGFSARSGKNTLYGIDNTEISETVLKYQISDFP